MIKRILIGCFTAFVLAFQVYAVNYFDILKCIISTNFIWAMFNSNNAISEFSLFSPEIAYKMPEAEKENYKSLDMPVWEISSDNISLKREGVELW